MTYIDKLFAINAAICFVIGIVILISLAAVSKDFSNTTEYNTPLQNPNVLTLNLLYFDLTTAFSKNW